MNLLLQYKIKQNPNYQKFLRENSNWYKYLNRNPDLFNNMVQDMKEKYKLTTSDRINNALNSIGMLQSLIDVLK